jgi:hypothetical protein
MKGQLSRTGHLCTFCYCYSNWMDNPICVSHPNKHYLHLHALAKHQGSLVAVGANLQPGTQ